MSETDRIVVNNVRLLEKRKGMKQKRVAMAANMKEQTLCDLLGGRKRILPEHIVALAGALGVTANDLLYPCGD